MSKRRKLGSMADHSEHNGHSAESAFAREALLSEVGPHPRLRLSQVHFRLGSRFISVWWLVQGSR